MYESDEEILKKRRNLFIIIGVVVFLILILLIFLLIRNSGKKSKKPTITAKEITCSLEVKNNVTADTEGVYHQSVEVGFKNITAISKDYQIIKQTVGTVDRSSNKETFSAQKSGTYHLHGYVQDSAGNKGKCDLDVVISLSVPSCELEVTKGTVGDNAWYKTDIEVGFKNMNSNNPTTSISKFYIEKQPNESDLTIDETNDENQTNNTNNITTDSNNSNTTNTNTTNTTTNTNTNATANTQTNQVTKADPVSLNVEKYVVTDDKTTTLVGYVIDSNGSEGSCTITVSKDVTIPTCKLKVLSGTKNSSGEYTDEPEIGFEEVKDDVSGVVAQGIGVSKNYTQKTFKVTDTGKTTVVGYVKDKAGNEGTCSITIERPGPAPTPQTTSKPTCQINLSPNLSSRKYDQDVKVTLTYATTNGATITKYGLAETQTYNQKKEVTITQNGNHTMQGIVQDSNGNVATCKSPQFNIDKGYLLSEKVQVGDYVNYDAGKWSETKQEKSKPADGYVWGSVSGTSRQTGVKCNKRDSGTKNGWIVFSVTNKKVVLIHAGTPECIYHELGVSTSTVISTMNSEAKKFINSNYAESAGVLSCGNYGFDCNQSKYTEAKYITGNHYWIEQNGKNNTLYFISATGYKNEASMISYGIRPVVVLKASVRTSGKKDDAWVLK